LEFDTYVQVYFLPVRVCWVALSMFDFRLSTISCFRRLVGQFALIFAHTVGSTCNLSVSPWGVVPTVDVDSAPLAAAEYLF
jgi:hypothetical protein